MVAAPRRWLDKTFGASSNDAIVVVTDSGRIRPAATRSSTLGITVRIWLRATVRVLLRPKMRAAGILTEACKVPAQLQIPSGAVALRAAARPRGSALESTTKGA